MSPRQDFLRDCMAPFGNVQLDAFNREFCLVCANRECARSSANNSSFDARVLSWKDRLFDNVPRAHDLDTSFDHIRAKRFLPIQGQAYEVRLDRPPLPPARATAPEPAVARPQPPTGPQVLANTPFQQGQMIGDGEKFLQPGGSFTFGGEDE